MSDDALRATEAASRSPARAFGVVVGATLAVAVASYLIAFGIADQLADGTGVVVYGIGVLVVAACGWRVAERGRLPRVVGAVVGVLVAVLVAIAVTIVAFLAAPCPGVGC